MLVQAVVADSLVYHLTEDPFRIYHNGHNGMKEGRDLGKLYYDLISVSLHKLWYVYSLLLY